MRARKYNKKIAIWQTSKVSDGFGGNTIVNTLLTSTWCEIVTLNSLSRSTDFGMIDTSDTLILKLRKRNDLTYNSKIHYFVYRDEKYLMQGQPVNIGFEDREIQITVKKAVN